MSDLLSWIPPVLGETFSEPRDGGRLAAQYLRVRALMLDGKFRSLAAISAATGDPQASVSARLRDMRRNGFKVEREYFDKGVWLYRAIKQAAE
jgi:hypothetical protein